MRILGINDGHNASAALLEDGVTRAVLQEERFTGVKEQTGFPGQSIRGVLRLTGLTIDRIDEVAMATESPPGGSGIVHQVVKRVAPTFYGKNRNASRLAQIRALGFNGPVSFVNHHTSHAASAYYSSPWRDGVLVLSLDGAGDGLCATVSVGENGTLRRIAQTTSEHSLGYIYRSATKYLGMKPNSHEWKVMGLAPYAPKELIEPSYNKFASYIGLEGLEFKKRFPEPIHQVSARMKDDLFGHRFDAIAAGLQKRTEELVVEWTKTAMRRTGLQRIAVAGGVFMNVRVNKLIREMVSQ